MAAGVIIIMLVLFSWFARRILVIERIDEVVATGFSVYIGRGHGIDVRKMRSPHHWGWSWEGALYLCSPGWMLTLG